jgi:predicted ATPase
VARLPAASGRGPAAQGLDADAARQGGEAEAQLRASIDWARRQQANSRELRSSTTLAELLVARGQRDAARELLAPIYAWFTEGLDTHDLKAARALLESLR